MLGTLASRLAWGTACLSCLSSLVWGGRKRSQGTELRLEFELNGAPGLVKLKCLVFCLFAAMLGLLFPVFVCLELILDGKRL